MKHLVILPKHVAIKLGLNRYCSLTLCKSGHFGERKISNGGCVECANMRRNKVKVAHYNIVQRCYNPKHKSYKYYGALGLTFQFKDDYDGFLSEIGDYPSDGQKWSVERIDNALGYVAGNMKWELLDKQARHKGKQSNNKTGVTGVQLWDGFFKATWYDLEGKQNIKCFSIKSLGYELAFRLACDHRKKMIDELNLMGAGYHCQHGE